MSDVETVIVTAADGQELAVHSQGFGPPLLCVPGGPGRASTYLRDLGGLASSRRLVMLDMRGSGRSPLPAERASLAFTRLADDVETVTVALGLGAVPVLAHSSGCYVALAYAARCPDAVSQLVLVTPSGLELGHDDEVSVDLDRVRLARSGEPWWPEVVDELDAQRRRPTRRRERLGRAARPLGYARWDEDSQAHAHATDREMSVRAAASFRPWPGALRPGEPTTLAELVAVVPTPTLVVVGDADGVTGSVAGRLLPELMPAAVTAALTGCGHYPWIDVPDAFAATVEAFLAG